MIQQILYIFRLRNSLPFKFKFLLEKLMKIPFMLLEKITGKKRDYLYLFRKDYILKNSLGNWKVKAGTDYDFILSPFFESYLSPYFQLEAGNIFFDIGAHVGKWSMFVAKQDPSNQVYSIEANKYTYNYLKENIELNSLAPQIQAINIGFSDHNGTETLVYDTKNTGTSGIGVEKNGRSFIEFQVPITPFDDYIRENKISVEKIALIKIDVEGHEYYVVQGMQNFLKERQAGITIICEINPRNPDKEKILELFTSNGFREIARPDTENFIFSK